jgi:hypothetical protein
MTTVVAAPSVSPRLSFVISFFVSLFLFCFSEACGCLLECYREMFASCCNVLPGQEDTA